MPNVMGREFPYTADGMAAAQQYEQAMGMRGGGSMGFRPIGMQVGGMMGQEAAEGGGLIDRSARGETERTEALTDLIIKKASNSDAGAEEREKLEMLGPGIYGSSRERLIPYLMSMTGMGPDTFAPMSTEELQIAYKKLTEQKLNAANQQVLPLPDNLEIFKLMEQQRQPMPMQPMPENMGNLGRIEAMVPTDYYPPETRESNQPYYPELPMMAGGGIMSLRGY